MTNIEIHYICKKYNIKDYTINPDGSIDVEGEVVILVFINELPIKFNKVSGNFYCSYNDLSTLKNFPNEVGGKTVLYNNPLESLEGYNGDYDKLSCDNKDYLILKHKRSKKLKILDIL
jgi:hypothetical protein